MTDAMKEMTEQPKVTRVDFVIGEQRFAFYPGVGIVPGQVAEISTELKEQLQQLSETVNAFAKTPLLAAEVTRLTKAIEDAPHAPDCSWKPPIWRTELEDVACVCECTCWKSTLTASEKPEEESKLSNEPKKEEPAYSMARLYREKAFSAQAVKAFLELHPSYGPSEAYNMWAAINAYVDLFQP